MNPRSPLLQRLVVFVAAFVLFGSHAGAQRDSEFMTKFREAMGYHDRDTMVALLKKHDLSAVMAIIDTCELIAAGSNDELESEIEELGQSWRAAYDTSFVSDQYEYFSLISGANKRHRYELIERYRAKFGEFDKAREEEDTSKLLQVGLEFRGLSESFEDVGDLYMASVCALHYGQCFDESLLGHDADLRRACTGFGRAIEMREKIGLIDSLYKTTKERFDTLEYEGFGDPSRGPEARAAARAHEDPSYAPHALEASFKLARDIEEVARPLYFADSAYQTWTQLLLGGNDSTASFPAMERSPSIIRESAAKAAVDVNGDGVGDVNVPVNGKMAPVEITIGDGESERKWGFLATVGQERDTYQGIQPFNLGPNDVAMAICIAPAASIVGMIGDTEVQIFDDNMDGVYGGAPVSWQNVGLVDGSSQLDTDSIRIGKAKRAVPWSEFVKVGEDWYKFEPDETGGDVIVSKRDLETGMLKLDMKGLSVDYLIVRGKGNGEGVFIDVAASKKGVEVPVGSYELFAGRVSKGKRGQMMKALVLPGRNTPSWTVDPGITETIKLGAPFGFGFSFRQTDEEVSIDGKSVHVTGRGNETYQRLWNCVPRPEASERVAGSKKGGKPIKMKPFESQETMAEMGAAGFFYLWFPRDGKLTKKKKGEDVEVQLVEKKNKLFGKITSEWKAE